MYIKLYFINLLFFNHSIYFVKYFLQIFFTNIFYFIIYYLFKYKKFKTFYKEKINIIFLLKYSVYKILFNLKKMKFPNKLNM